MSRPSRRSEWLPTTCGRACLHRHDVPARQMGVVGGGVSERMGGDPIVVGLFDAGLSRQMGPTARHGSKALLARPAG
jgi:hypothetical protein